MFSLSLIIFTFVTFAKGEASTKNERENLLSSLYFNVENIDVKLLLCDNSSETLLNKTNLGDTMFNSSKETVFIIGGWRGLVISPMVQMVKEAYLKTKDMNVIIVDWDDIADNGYDLARLSVLRVGKALGKLIKRMVDTVGLNLDKTGLVGFSLGAHVAGIASRKVGKNIGHITGLNPAGPLFSDPTNKYRLKKGDAKFVQIIHTCSMLGYSFETGDADYWPNGGFFHQPGCENDITGICSHNRAYELYIESLETGNFLAKKCQNYLVYSSGICDENETGVMGNHAFDRKHGNFFLNTNGISPFANG